MKRLYKLLFTILLLPAPVLAEVINFTWNHDKVGTAGYKLYKSTDQQNWTVVANISDPELTAASYNKTTVTVECFGVTAYSGSGEESTMTTKRNDGSDVCLGKPTAPTTFSFSAP